MDADILAMRAGRDLDRLVAERVMGWTKIAKNSSGLLVGEPPDARPRHRTQVVPFWSLDWAMAWQLADALIRKGWQLSAQYGEPGGGQCGGWTVGLERGERRVVAQGVTWPEALCRAAVGGMEEGSHDER